MTNILSTTEDIRNEAQGWNSGYALRDIALFGDGGNTALADGCSVTIVDDENEHEFNAQNNQLFVAEFTMRDGVQRVGIYSDGAKTIIDALDEGDTVETWANSWVDNCINDLESVPTMILETATEYEDEVQAALEALADY